MTWDRESSRKRIKEAWSETEGLVVKPLVREASLENLSLKQAYRVDGVHVFAAIPNARSLLDTNEVEGEMAHKRYLRLMHLYQRAAHALLAHTEAQKVDFQNERLHFMLHKPYDDEKTRIADSVVIADALLLLVATINDLHEEMPDASVRCGIESGKALAVRNGTKGDREPLFLGNSVNHAARLSGGKDPGVYLGAAARLVLGDKWKVENPSTTPLNPSQIEELRGLSTVELDVERAVERYEEEKEESLLSDFKFYRPTPPLSTLDPDSLSPKRTARIESTATMADIDGFTKYVSERIDDDKKAATAVRVLHVIRKELRDVLRDFGGRKVRYIGDCLQGVLAEGERETDPQRTVRSMVRCAGALRSSFNLIQEEIADADDLGLAVGLDVGPLSISRLGMKGSLNRALVGRAVVSAESSQRACTGTETEIGEEALAGADDGVKVVFKLGRRRADLDFEAVELELTLHDNQQEEEKKNTNASRAGSPTVIVPRAYNK